MRRFLVLTVLSFSLLACGIEQTLAPPPTLTPTCTTHSATMALSASATTIRVGETLTVTAALDNTGCVALGMPQSRLYITSPEGEMAFAEPEPVVNYAGVDPGQTDTATFVLTATQAGQATLSGSASFEVHLGYPGPAYWGGSSSNQPLVIVVEVE
ncbi:MAG: hypothetical protein JW934_02730 [Anaerolineae bacterium]|nr:hypothetical protein [Anaerolineae bacterium]